jgi:hypothetical protein
MQKKILYGVAVLAVAALATFNLKVVNNNHEQKSDVSMTNVEALASESGWYVTSCLGLNNKECTTPRGSKSTGPLVEGGN